MIAGIISYIGSSILGIFVFYHSWVQVIRQDELEDISVLISASGCEHSPLFLFDEDSIRKQYPHVVSRHLSVETQTKFEINSFFKVTLTNCNYFLPIQLEITELYYLDDNDEFKKIYPIKIRSKVDLAVPLDYKEKTELLIGIPKEVFLLNRYKDHSVFYISACCKINNPKSNIRYGVINIIGGKCFRSSIGIFTEDQKIKLERKFNSIAFLDESDKSYLKMMCSTHDSCQN